MNNIEHEEYVRNGEACPWCGYLFGEKDIPLKHHETGRAFCDRTCYELDTRFPATLPDLTKRGP